MSSKVKIAGYSIHPLLVAYLIALSTATLVAYTASAAHNDPFYFRTGELS